MSLLYLKQDIKKVGKILDADYNHENPEAIRSKKFGNAFTTLLKHLFPEYEIIPSNCYCEASGFVRNSEGKYIYYSTEDYRHPIMGKSWIDSILYRKAKNDKDFFGERNNFTNIYLLRDKIKDLFKED